MDGQGTYNVCPCDNCTCAHCDFNAKMIHCAALQSLHIPHIKALYIWSQVQLSQCLRQSSELTITYTEETSWNQSVWVHTIWASSLSNCKNTNGKTWSNTLKQQSRKWLTVHIKSKLSSRLCLYVHTMTKSWQTLKEKLLKILANQQNPQILQNLTNCRLLNFLSSQLFVFSS